MERPSVGAVPKRYAILGCRSCHSKFRMSYKIVHYNIPVWRGEDRDKRKQTMVIDVTKYVRGTKKNDSKYRKEEKMKG